jgi:hypothetical protein
VIPDVSIRFGYARKRLDRLREDVGEWARDHDHVREVWRCEDLIRDAVQAYESVERMDEDVRVASAEAGHIPAEYDSDLRALLASWLADARTLIPVLARCEADFEVVGADGFRRTLREVERILAPDTDTFSGERLATLESRALADFRAGLAEPV